MRGRKRKLPANFVPPAWIPSDEEEQQVPVQQQQHHEQLQQTHPQPQPQPQPHQGPVEQVQVQVQVQADPQERPQPRHVDPQPPQPQQRHVPQEQHVPGVEDVHGHNLQEEDHRHQHVDPDDIILDDSEDDFLEAIDEDEMQIPLPNELNEEQGNYFNIFC